MKIRLSLFIFTIGVFAATAAAQNNPSPGVDAGFTHINIQRVALHPLDLSALPDQQKVPVGSKAFGESPKPPNPSDPPSGQTVAVTPTIPTQCEEPAKLFSARDYTGPGKRFAAWFTRKPEMTTVPKRTGAPICSLEPAEKFHLFYKATVDPVTFVGAGFSAAYSQWQNDDKEWGQGAQGYGYRYAAAMGDRVVHNFFRKFFYPTIFRQDPRYFRMGSNGTTGQRLGHALGHAFVTRTDGGGKFANISLWAAVASTAAIEPLYHPGLERGFRQPAERAATALGISMGWDVAKEFWPEIVRKLKLPFHERQNVPSATGNP